MSRQTKSQSVETRPSPFSRNLVVGLATSACTALAFSACRAPASNGEFNRVVTRNADTSRRAIVLSIDSFNEERILSSVALEAIPAIRALFDSSACAAYARPAVPSVTAPGHASLWTGSYGDVNGITANSQPVLPRDLHTTLEATSGFDAANLRAEPIWITAGSTGMTVVAHHATQSPDAPGYPSIDSADGSANSATRSLRDHAESVLARSNVHVVNGYNRRLAPDLVIDEKTAPPRAAAGWRNVDGVRTELPLREIAWAAGDDSVFALLLGDSAYYRVLVAPARDAALGVIASAAPVERSPSRDRELARHFSDPIAIETSDGVAHLRVRLFAMAPDGSSFLIFQPALHIVEANRPEVASAYAYAVRGWTGNGASRLLDDGRFGPTITDGGDGTAESRYLESLEYLTRQSMRGTEWAWQHVGATLLLDYTPVGDEIDHRYFGYLAPNVPGYDAALAAKIRPIRDRAWSLVDIRLAHLRELIASDPNAALFVTGDHGMRATWRTFKPNVALMNLGVLSVDTAWRIDLSRTRALSPNGYWVMLNSTDWKEGIVGPDTRDAALAAAERALTLARAPDGTPIVTRIWRAAEHDSLGIGGAAGGDLYYELAPGYYPSSATSGPLTESTAPDAGHGFPSTAPDMRTVFCALGSSFAPRRTGTTRTIDVAPTVSDWLGVPAPLHSRGRSILPALLGGEPD
ncbi:MAG: alkaline phosphatase family protein [Gemmatimonadaceae bacterium]